jgi:AbrB family looped-hinge helix DNA binding protein
MHPGSMNIFSGIQVIGFPLPLVQNQYMFARKGDIMKIDLDDVAYVGETSVTIRQSRRRITIPKEIIDRLDIKDGDKIRWVLFNDGRLCISSIQEAFKPYIHDPAD